MWSVSRQAADLSCGRECAQWSLGPSRVHVAEGTGCPSLSPRCCAFGALSPWGWDSEVAALGLPAAIPASGTCKVALWLLLEGGQRFPFPRKGPFGELGRRAQTQVTSVLEELEGWG